jgi:hypothetical protein
MRGLVLIVCLVACVEHGKGGAPSPSDRPPLPVECENRCIVDEPVKSFEDCCDSVTCWFDETTNEWDFVICDPPMPADPCLACGPDEI